MILRLALILSGLSILLGAFGAHILDVHLTSMQMNTFHTAQRYMFWHCSAILLISILHKTQLITSTKPALFFLAGILLFSGSLFAYLATSIKFFVFITPLGGLLFVSGWLYAAFKIRHDV